MNMHPEDEWTTITGIVGNRGDHATFDDIIHALEGPHGEPVCDFATLVEMRDQQKTLTRIDARPTWEVHRGETKAEIVILNTQTMTSKRELDAPLLLAAAKRPPRVGKFNTAKYPTSVECIHKTSKRHMCIHCLHNIQSLWMLGRRAAGRRHNQNFVDWADEYNRLTFAGMDSNDVPTGHSMLPFREAGWAVQFPIATHKKPNPKRAIDGFCVDQRDFGEPVLKRPSVHPINVHGTDHLWAKFVWPIKVVPSHGR